ncbi:electron transport complex protein RnfC [Porphyromonas crevioricanis JCM 15906]|uniref:Ion-translocating oxidoreductase complex subunit C n=2 Tax=Porphyromonas crevioricanis TaxID=393921 RepID=A0A2X4PKF8_9PORP|nr:electron transport complex subunit RsxC [Porphyromonas crevioricanis]KGN95319.1 electron transporter RnfC [Porphyromonas crevioricanis]SJZ60354.1 electron transport complex protein RnfC [Porphyromonas crevioricanis]SQH72785.1 Nitrogen fixation protein rnfC [Porphyromonas crevioricanis]GAD05661.1 electron transport complex protein RnfC [Porphyromonas crevioricanis JCM 15906]GAD06547.1 electron transport complex protein RnfC [Porphyromonas crevioricanis JCM 13913]
MLRTFRLGGIHPPENKLSAGKPIEVLTLPKQVAIPLGQHIGAPATAVVNKGDEVKVGTLIAQASGFVSANIYSSVSGKVAKLDTQYDASGYKKPVIIIDVEGDEWVDTIDRSTELQAQCDLEPKAIIDKILAAGIVGLGGATFPTHVKLSPPPGSTPQILIINAVECEPYLTSDHALMMAKGEEIMVGCQILMKAIGVNRTVIGVENNKPDAIRHLSSLAAKYSGIEVMPLKVQYPQGGEKQLIDAVIRKQVKSGALPISTGAVVQNVGTVFAVYEAVQKNKPLVERIVTITGKKLASPSNYLVRVGTPIANLIEAAGGLPEDTGKIIGGGPMMGKALLTPDVPVTKGTSGVLLLSREESERKPMEPCIRCAKCVSACPMGLNPAFLMRDTKFKDWEGAEANYIFDCIECGSCSYTCPAHRPLLDYIRLGKQTVMGIIRSRSKK